MSLQAQVIKLFTRVLIKRNGLNEQQLVKHLRKSFSSMPALKIIPRGVSVSKLDTEGFSGDYVATANPQLTLLYIHGGAYIGGITQTYHNLAGRLASQLNAEVYLLRYPFAPEYPFPAACHCVLEAYEYLLAQGKNPQNIVLAGDSAGGGLTLAALLQIRDKALALPRCAVTFSPGSNCFPDEQELLEKDKSDAMLSADIIRMVIDIYVPNEVDRTNPYASPCLGDYTGLPPLMILVSSEELLYGDALRVRKAAEASGVSVEWFERKGVFHVWPIMLPFLPEANADIKEVINFILKNH